MATILTITFNPLGGPPQDGIAQITYGVGPGAGHGFSIGPAGTFGSIDDNPFYGDTILEGAYTYPFLGGALYVEFVGSGLGSNFFDTINFPSLGTFTSASASYSDPSPSGAGRVRWFWSGVGQLPSSGTETITITGTGASP